MRDYTPEVTPEVRLLNAISRTITRQQLQVALGLKDDEHFLKVDMLLSAQFLGYYWGYVWNLSI